MHVLIIPSWYPAYPGDVSGSFFREQANALHKAGCKVGVIHPQYRSLKQWKTIVNGRYSFEVSEDCGVKTYRIHGMNWFPRLPDLHRRAWIRNCILLFQKYISEQGLPDIIHVHSIFNAGFAALEIKEKYGIPFIVTEHSSAFARKIVAPKYIRLASRVAENAEKLIGVSPEFCHLLSDTLKNGKRWLYIPNIVNTIFLEKKVIKKKSEEFIFINVAIATERKAQKNIIHAMALRFKDKKHIKLIIGGDGPELEPLKKLVSNYGISEQVQFLGKLTREQVLTAMSQADGFILSSRHEPFGVVLIEALALGLPVIATRCGGPESIVREKDGLLVPVDDIESLSVAMQTLVENRDQFNSEEIRQACRSRFSEEVIADRLIGIYCDICSGSSPVRNAN